jgi:penicillin amidase
VIFASPAELSARAAAGQLAFMPVDRFSPVRPARCSRAALIAAATTLALGCGDEATRPPGEGGGGAGTASSIGTGGAAPEGPEIPGLSAPVRATYDEHGILHLVCATDDDCYAALGYFHASNRFFFMDFVRSSIRGTLGALVKAGDLVIERDFANRRFFSTRDGEPLETKLVEQASPEVRGYLEAYGRGVNAWIGDMRAGRNGATLTTEYDFALIVKDAIRDWEPADSTAVGLYIMNDFSNKSSAELALAEVSPYFDQALAADLFSARPVFKAFALPKAQMQASFAPAPGSAWSPLAPRLTPLVARARAAMADVGSGNEVRHPGETGSNNWVLSAARTAAGQPLLADDPHIALTNPAVWFPVEIDATSEGTGTYHVAGSTFPGLPSVMVGHNESIAWGLTAANWDLADTYVEQMSADGAAVRFQNQDVPVVEKTIELHDASVGATVTRIARWVPHHGPIVSEDPSSQTALTVRWRGHDGGTDLDGFFAVGRARTTAEAKAGVELITNACQNFVIADLDGNIGHYPFSAVPSRPWASAALPPWLPLPGDGSAEWAGSVPLDDLPQATNPPAGAIVTANQDLTGASADGDLFNENQAAIQAITRAEGTRARRILDLIADGGDDHTVASMNAIQGDDLSLYGSVVVPAVLAAAAGQALTADEQSVIDALSQWQYTCPTGLDGSDPSSSGDSMDADEAAESIGCTAFHAVLYSLAYAALGDDIADADAASPSTVALTDRSDVHLVVRALKDPASLSSGDLIWDDVSTTDTIETRDETLLVALGIAAGKLAETGLPNQWRWGRVHTFSLRSIYDAFGVTTYNVGPYAAPGGLYTVNVANPVSPSPADDSPWSFDFAMGASVRFVVEVGPDRPHMTYQLPGGTDLHRESPFFNQLLENWLDNRAIDFPFGPGAVSAPAVVINVNPSP